MTEDTMNELIDNPDLVIKLAQNLKDERNSKVIANKQVEEQKLIISQKQEEINELSNTVQTLSDENKVMSKKSGYFDAILASKNTFFVKQIAVDYGMTANKLNKILHDAHIQYYVGGQWILYKEYIDKGYVTSETIPCDGGKTGIPFTKLCTKWTQKGRLFIYEVLKEKGILPSGER